MLLEMDRFALRVHTLFYDENLRVYQWSEDVVPTVAFHFRKVRKGNVTMKIWDLAGEHLLLNSLTVQCLAACSRSTKVVWISSVLCARHS